MLRKVSILLLVLLMFGLSACFVAFDPRDHMHDQFVDALNRPLAGTDNATVPSAFGQVTVVLSLANGYITNARVSAPGATPSYTRELLRAASDIIIATNSPAIDGFSGATITRNAIREAGRAVLTELGADNIGF